MKLMAVGEVGANLIGLTSSIASFMYLGDLALALRIMASVAVLYFATKWSLWFVHLGFDGKVDERA